MCGNYVCTRMDQNKNNEIQFLNDFEVSDCA